MRYHNQNQIERMKINKKEFRVRPMWQKFPEAVVEKVVYPFIPNIQGKNIKVYLCRKSAFQYEINLDWSKYELILFNVFQNAIKYNEFFGDILIIIDCYPKNNYITLSDFVFETTIIDTGSGIS
jgi:signal transduction histidine kinase